MLSWLQRLLREEDPKQLLPLAEALPLQTTILREPAVKLTERLARYFRHLAERSQDVVAWDKAAASLTNLAIRLRDLGRREQALAAAEEAVQLYRTLAEAHPDAVTPDLAASLNNLASSLSELGRPEQAFVAAEEAADLYRTLAEARPDAFTPNLASSLNNSQPR